MAIQPIDLQTLFTQMDKVAKAQMMQREGQQIHETIQQQQTQRKLEENIQSVNESQNAGNGAESIRDDKRRRAHQGGSDEKSPEEEDTEEERAAMIRDPALGRNIDISG